MKTLLLFITLLQYFMTAYSVGAQTNNINSNTENGAILLDTSWLKSGSTPYKYQMGIDTSIKYQGRNVMTIKADDSASFFLGDFGSVKQTVKANKYIGRKIRLTGYMKSKNVTNWAAFWLRVDQLGNMKSIAFDNMQNRPIKGTTDWKEYEIVLDVPEEASNIVYGALLIQSGQIWFDNITIEAVDDGMPIPGLHTP